MAPGKPGSEDCPPWPRNELSPPLAQAGPPRRNSRSKKRSKDPASILEQRIASGREKEVLEMIKQTPALLNDPLDDLGMRPLQAAAQAGHVDLVKALLAKGALVNGANKQGGTALMYAAAGGHDKICKLILDAGADVRMVDAERQNALQYAQLNNRQNVEKLLQMYACEYTW